MEKKAFEQTGLIPRSIIRTFDRFRKQILPGAETVVIKEFRISRYQVVVSVKCLLVLFIFPLVVNYLVKQFFFTPIAEYIWNTQQPELFINSYQKNRAFSDIQNFEEKIYFESLLIDPADQKPVSSDIEFQNTVNKIASKYNQESIESITNFFSDGISLVTIYFLIYWMKPQIIILRSFLTESIYSLSDTTKSFLLILFTDLLVGFHSPHGWEVFLEFFLRHFGFPENQDFILLFVATVPVLLDTVFKYWIFRYLNKISPSTVATYHNMIE